MAEVNAKDLTTKTSPASTDSMLLFGTTSNEGAKITVDNLADNILSRLSTKTFPNQVGGSSAATILAQLATLNSNINTKIITDSLPSQTAENEKDFLLVTGEYLNNTYDTNAKFFCNVTWSGYTTYNLVAQMFTSGVKMLIWSSSEVYSATVYTTTSTNVFVRLNFTNM